MIRNRRHRCTRTRSQRVGKKLPSLTDHVRRSARSNVPRTDIWIAVQRTDNHNRRRFTDNPHRRVKNAFRYIPDGIHGYPVHIRIGAHRCEHGHSGAVRNTTAVLPLVSLSSRSPARTFTRTSRIESGRSKKRLSTLD